MITMRISDSIAAPMPGASSLDLHCWVVILAPPLRINNHTLGHKHPRVNHQITTKSQAIKSPAEAGLVFRLLPPTSLTREHTKSSWFRSANQS